MKTLYRTLLHVQVAEVETFKLILGIKLKNAFNFRGECERNYYLKKNIWVTCKAGLFAGRMCGRENTFVIVVSEKM